MTTKTPGRGKAAGLAAFLSVFLLIPSPRSRALESLALSTLPDSEALTPHLETLVDKAGTMTLPEALLAGEGAAPGNGGGESARPARFARPEGGDFNYGYTRAAVWARFRLVNDTGRPVDRYLEYAYPPINRVELFSPTPGGAWTGLVLGNTRPFGEKPIKSRNPVFPIHLAPGEDATFLVRVTSAGTLDLNLALWEPSAFHEHEREMQIIYGLLFGVALIMGAYNFFLYLYTRDPASLAYLGFTVGFCAIVATIRGFTFEYLLGAMPSLNNEAMPVSIGLADLTGGIFTRIFLDTKRQFPRLDKFLLAFIAGGGLVIALGCLLPYRLIVPAGAFLTFPGVVILFTAGVASLAKGHRAARFYTAAWGALLAGVFLTAVHAFGVLGPGFLTSYGLELGATAQVVLLSVSLADRFHLARKQGDELKARAFEEQRRAAESFSRFVPREFLESIGKPSVEEVELGDHAIRCMTVLFSDIRSFTTMLEGMSAEEAFRFINSYMKRVGPLVRQSGGFIDKYIGDAIMALFPERPERALEAAIAMQRALVVYNAHRHRSGFRPVHVGMGLHYGRLSIGTIGEEGRMDTTVISDAVNIASRLEGLTKRYHAHILASGAFMEALADRAAFSSRFLGSVHAKGKRRVLEVHEVLDTLDGRTREQRLANAPILARASGLMRESRWTEAADLLDAEIACDRDPAIDLCRWQCARSMAGSRLPPRKP